MIFLFQFSKKTNDFNDKELPDFRLGKHACLVSVRYIVDQFSFYIVCREVGQLPHALNIMSIYHVIKLQTNCLP